MTEGFGGETVDVAVVGGGPAGSAAAITLARSGRSVAVLDRATFPRDKCCGDGLTAAALRRLEALGFDPASAPSWAPVEEATVVTPGSRAVRLRLPADGTLFAASVRRLELDAALLDVARKAGAEVYEGHPVSGVGAAAGGAAVVLSVDGEPALRARYVIAADGAWSPVRKALGLSEAGYLGDWYAGRQYYRGVGPAARGLWVWFEPDMLPGYAWSFPLAGGVVNVGYGVVRVPGGPPGTLKGQRVDLLGRPRVAAVLGPDAEPAGPWKAWPIPAGIGAATLSGLGGRVLFAGDAARACDPMTGEGIAQALETGEMAARAVLAAGPDRPGAAHERYRRQVRWGLAVDDSLSRFLSRVLARRRGADGSLALVDTAAWCRRNFARWMFEDYPRAALVTPHRWRRRMFTSPGAFSSDGAHQAGSARS